MGFVEELRQRKGAMSPSGVPYGSTGVATPMFGPQDNSSIASTMDELMPAFHQIRNRNMADFQEQSNFASDLSLKQDFLRSRMNPAGNQPQNVVYQPNAAEAAPPVTPFQKAGLDLESRKLAQSGRIGDEKLALDKQGFGLDQLKNEQIFNTKSADMQRKVDDANAKLELARERLMSDQASASSLLMFKNAQADALAQREALKAEQAMAQQNINERIAAARINKLESDIALAGGPITTERKISPVDPDTGQTSTTTVTRGRGPGPVGSQNNKLTDPLGLRK